MPHFTQLSDLLDALDLSGALVSDAARVVPEPKSPAESTPAYGIQRSLQITQPGHDGVLADSSELWYERGSTYLGQEISNRCITSSGKIVEPSELMSRCFRCGGFEDELLRNDLTYEALCYRCLREVTRADGTVVRVTPEQAAELDANFDEWQFRDLQRSIL